jgi:hypothetical protein
VVRVDELQFDEWLRGLSQPTREFRLSDEEKLMQDLLKGGALGYNLPPAGIARKSNYMDAIREEYGIGVKQLKLADLEVALPLMGLRVMVNPQHFERVDSRVKNVSGTIISSGGNSFTEKNIIKKYKQNGMLHEWSVTVLFDNKRREHVKIGHLLPIANGHKNVYKVEFQEGDIMRWTEEEYKEKMNEYVIKYGWEVKRLDIYDDAYRQKLLDEA